jgi:hypothetical protein
MNLNENRVREFAYQIWESEGRPHGQHHRHWEMACKLAANQTPNQKTMDGQQTLAGNGVGNGSATTQADAPQKKSRNKKQPAGSDTKAVKKAAETKSTTAKTTRQKKAKVLSDTVDTELSPITDGFEGSV